MACCYSGLNHQDTAHSHPLGHQISISGIVFPKFSPYLPSKVGFSRVSSSSYSETPSYQWYKPKICRVSLTFCFFHIPLQLNEEMSWKVLSKYPGVTTYSASILAHGGLSVSLNYPQYPCNWASCSLLPLYYLVSPYQPEWSLPKGSSGGAIPVLQTSPCILISK